MKYLLSIVYLLFSLNVLAAVDTTGITLTSQYAGPGNEWLMISHGPNPIGPSRGSSVYLNFTPSGSIPASISFVTVTANSGADIYIVQSGQTFSSSSIASNSFTTLFFGSPFDLTNPRGGYSSSGTFFLGINSGQDIYSPVDRSIYGWAEFSYSPSGLSLISSAVTYDQAGIIVGTTTTIAAVPEPSEWLLMIIGLVLLSFVARRRMNDSCNNSITL